MHSHSPSVAWFRLCAAYIHCLFLLLVLFYLCEALRKVQDRIYLLKFPHHISVCVCVCVTYYPCIRVFYYYLSYCIASGVKNPKQSITRYPCHICPQNKKYWLPSPECPMHVFSRHCHIKVRNFAVNLLAKTCFLCVCFNFFLHLPVASSRTKTSSLYELVNIIWHIQQAVSD